jgi:hypothetical protein
MILPASYANGFAPRDGHPLYPELWRGCVGAWAPCLGPTGLTLRDWSGRANHGTLSSASYWSPVAGRYALALNGAATSISCGTPAGLTGNVEVYLSAWCLPLSSSSLQIVCGKYTNTASTQELWIEYGRGGANLFRAVSGGNLVAASSACPAGSSYHVCLIRTGAAGAWTYTFVINGRVDTSGTTAVNPSGDGTFTISNVGLPFSGAVDDVRCGGRMSVNTAMQITSRRGIAYELAPRRRSLVQVAGFNRRRRLLLGST